MNNSPALERVQLDISHIISLHNYLNNIPTKSAAIQSAIDKLEAILVHHVSCIQPGAHTNVQHS